MEGPFFASCSVACKDEFVILSGERAVYIDAAWSAWCVSCAVCDTASGHSYSIPSPPSTMHFRFDSLESTLPPFLVIVVAVVRRRRLTHSRLTVVIAQWTCRLPPGLCSVCSDIFMSTSPMTFPRPVSLLLSLFLSVLFPLSRPFLPAIARDGGE